MHFGLWLPRPQCTSASIRLSIAFLHHRTTKIRDCSLSSQTMAALSHQTMAALSSQIAAAYDHGKGDPSRVYP